MLFKEFMLTFLMLTEQGRDATSGSYSPRMAFPWGLCSHPEGHAWLPNLCKEHAGLPRCSASVQHPESRPRDSKPRSSERLGRTGWGSSHCSATEHEESGTFFPRAAQLPPADSSELTITRVTEIRAAIVGEGHVTPGTHRGMQGSG